MGNCCGHDQANTLELQFNQKAQAYQQNKIEKSKRNNFNIYKYNERNSLLQSSNAINFEIERNSLTPVINDILSRYNFIDLDYSIRESKIPKERFVERLRSDQLFNIILSHQDDFSESKYVIYDLRTLRKESFLKKAKQLNYQVKELKIASNSIIRRVKKFLNRKKIIILLDKAETIVDVEEFIMLITKNKFECCVKLLDNDLTREASLFTTAFSDFLDKRINKHIPYILAQLQHYPYLGSNKFIFLNYNCKVDDYCSIDFERNFFTCIPSVNNFIEYFNLNSFIFLTSDNLITSKIQNLHKDIIYLSQSIIIDNLSSLDSLAEKSYFLIEAIGTMLCAIDDENSGLILIDENLNPELLNYLLYIFIRKLLKVPSKLVYSILIDNPIYPELFIEAVDENQNKMEEFYIKNIDNLEKSLIEKSTIEKMSNEEKKNTTNNSSTIMSNSFVEGNKVSKLIKIFFLFFIF